MYADNMIIDKYNTCNKTTYQTTFYVEILVNPFFLFNFAWDLNVQTILLAKKIAGEAI